MEFDFGNRGSRLQKEQEKRKADARQRLAKEKAAKEEARRHAEALEAQIRSRKLEQIRQEEEVRRLEEEERRKTGGITYKETLRVVSANGEGDKIVLPTSALASLSEQDAIALGPMFFELIVPSSGSAGGGTSSDGASSASGGACTHAGVLEFAAEEGTVGVPPKVAECLGLGELAAAAETAGTAAGEAATVAAVGAAGAAAGPAAKFVTVKYVRLPRATFARVRPDTVGLSQVSELRGVLEHNLQQHATLTAGDIVAVWHRGRRFRATVTELRPEPQASLIDTDVEIEVDLPEAAQQAAQESAATRRAHTLRAHYGTGAGAAAAGAGKGGAGTAAEETMLSGSGGGASSAGFVGGGRSRSASPPLPAATIGHGGGGGIQSGFGDGMDTDDDEEDEAKAEPPFDPEKHRLEKLAGLPEEPPAGEADLVACVVRTGTGRLARRFRRSDRLQVLFDFVEAGGAPAGRYRLVTQFPRRALEVEAAAGQTFVEAGLTAKQEALILETL